MQKDFPEEYIVECGIMAGCAGAKILKHLWRERSNADGLLSGIGRWHCCGGLSVPLSRISDLEGASKNQSGEFSGKLTEGCGTGGSGRAVGIERTSEEEQLCG